MTDNRIAVVGMAIAAPRARTLEQLWHHLEQGVCCIEDWDEDEGAPANELDTLLIRHGRRVRAGGVLDDPAMFDADYFGMSRLDAELLDPQQRVFLEIVHDALENAATPPTRRQGIGVFAGCAMSSYLQYNLLPRRDLVERVGAYPLTLANDKDFLATRVSYKLGLGGPSLSVQTACSSSLVAIHVAMQSLLAGECDTAVAGGVSIRFPQRRGYLYQPDGVLSPDGRCRPFDHRGEGFVPSDGAVAVVLRRLEDALTDRDPVRAIVCASAVNNDGANRLSFTAPSVEGQVRVLAEALALSGLAPGDVTAIETHGTATALGDPVEFTAIEKVYGDSDIPCYIGAAKGNLGHLDTAAGALGFAKTVLALERGVIPPVVNFEAPNPKLGIAGTRFRIPRQAAPWPRGDSPRRGAVTSLGLGGTNAHVILEEPGDLEHAARAAAPRIFLVSARDPAALDVRCAAVADTLTSADASTAARLSHALATGTDWHAYRHAAVAPPGEPAPALTRRAAPPRPARPADALRIAWAFPGGGAQHPTMVRGLVEAYPAFGVELRAATALVESMGIANLDAAIHGDLPDAVAALRRPGLGLPALFCVQLALARLLLRWGVVPSAVIGHSAGEYAAACVAGILDPRDAAALVVARARLFETAPPGAMVSVGLPQAEVAARIPPGSPLEISVVNGPRETVLGGPTAAVAAFAEGLEPGIRWSRVAIDVAAHTSLVAPIAEDLRKLARTMRFSAPRIPLVSNVTGTWIGAEDIGADYWGAHLRQQVRFGDGLVTLLADPDLVVLDMGPSQTMAALVEQSGAASGSTVVVPLLPRPDASVAPAARLSEAVGRLWMEGAHVRWDTVFEGERVHRVGVPPHPLRRQLYWIEPPLESRRQRARTIDEWLHVPVLEPAPDDAGAGEPTRWVIFDDGSSLAAALRDRLRTGRVPFETVRPGTEVACVEPGVHTAPREDEAAFVDLFARLDAGGPPHAGLVLVRTGASEDPTATFHEMAALARAIGLAGARAPRQLYVVTRGSRATPTSAAKAPHAAMVAALARVVDNESPHLACKAVEVDPGEPDERTAAILADRMAHGARRHLVLRDGAAWTETFRPLVPPTRAPDLPARGVWVITGGLGAIGRTLAVHLATRSQARLVLVGRNAPAPDSADPSPEEGDRLRALAAIEAAGGQWELVVGDIADPDVARTAFARARGRFGAVHGVIHAAGVPAGGMIQLRDRRAADTVFAPKIGGVRALVAAMPDSVALLVLCSALDAVLGTLGQGEHCAANAWLDALAGAEDLRARRVVSIGWCAWRDIGQAARAVVPEPLRDWREQVMAEALTAEEGCRVFDAVLAGDTDRVLVSVASIQQLRRSAAEMLRRMPAASQARAPRAGGGEPRTPTERRVAELWAEVLKVADLGPQDDFFGLGGHSLAAMQLVSRMRETFDLPVRLQDLLERGGLAEQAELIDLLFLEKIEGLSDEEVARMLEDP